MSWALDVVRSRAGRVDGVAPACSSRRLALPHRAGLVLQGTCLDLLVQEIRLAVSTARRVLAGSNYALLVGGGRTVKGVFGRRRWRRVGTGRGLRRDLAELRDGVVDVGDLADGLDLILELMVIEGRPLLRGVGRDRASRLKANRATRRAVELARVGAGRMSR